MHYLTISFSYKNATMEIREKLSYPNDEDMHGCLKKLTSSPAINEAFLISTCNRMEVFCSCNDIEDATNYIFTMLSQRSKIAIEELEGRADIFDDSSAIHHLFSVAASLDSMVIGETQIAGQLKDAFRFALDHGYCAKKIARAVKSAFKCAAKVRNATDISSKPVSIASVAVTQLKAIMDFSGKKVLVIGVGEMAQITAKHLVAGGADVYIMNRTQHKAETLALEIGAKTLPFTTLEQAINEFTILYSATASPEPIITDSIIQTCDFDRYWFDLALPRDIKHTTGERINLYVIDDLKSIVMQNMGEREESAKAAHAIIGRAVVEYFEWLNSLDMEPVIKEIYKKAYRDANAEANRVLEKGFIPQEYEDQVQKMAQQVVKRFLHDMTRKMRSELRGTEIDQVTNAMQFLVKNTNN
ncbi:MAG: glutamyl-tRNA reductase [Sulfurimonadaceae bacterium]|jgi:glutamyl-tRNA reductase|nr:glutamyl-tRNA reductase [Sulfurimonadaceae bacterium]